VSLFWVENELSLFSNSGRTGLIGVLAAGPL